MANVLGFHVEIACTEGGQYQAAVDRMLAYTPRPTVIFAHARGVDGL